MTSSTINNDHPRTREINLNKTPLNSVVALPKNIRNTLFLYIILSPKVYFAPPENLVWLRV